MSKGMKVITVLAQLCLLTAAMDCKSRPELCIDDETSLIQMRQTLALGADNKQAPGTNSVGYTFEVSSVEASQNDLKAAQSNQSVQMYAAATARLDQAKALWAASKANLNARGATVQSITAERAAAAAVQAAQDEADAWYASLQSMMDADTQNMIAAADWTAKHNSTKITAAAAANASQFRQATQDNATIAKTNEQMLVNDAAANAASVYALNSKVVAASRLADQKAAVADYKSKRQASKGAQKAAWKSKLQARKDELKSQKLSWKAQRDMQKAAQQNVHQIVGGGKPQPYDPANPGGPGGAVSSITLALLQEEEKQPMQTDDDMAAFMGAANLAAYNDSALKVVQASSDLNAQAADTSVWAATSDEKRAKAAYDIARNAEKVAKNNKQIAQAKSDAAYKKETNLQYQAAKLARASRAALARAKQLAWQLNNTIAANTSAWNTAMTAENVTYQTADAVRITTDGQAAASAMVDGNVSAQTWKNANAAANASTLAATVAAQDAMISRVGAGYDGAYANAAKLNYTLASQNLSIAGKLKSNAMKAANQAESQATRAAWQAQTYDKKSAAANLSPDLATT